jgi:hypothetical protein
MVANSYSKAVLRVAAEQAAAEFDFVDYFPSYESITLSERDHAWTEDNVHVTQRAVETNVGRMVAAYTHATELDIEGVRDRLHELRGNKTEILSLLADRPELLDDPELANAFAEAALLAGQLEQASRALARGRLEPVLAARILMGQGDPEAALAQLGEKPPRATARSHFYGTKIRALLALAQIEAATEVANEWIAADRSTPQPYLLLARAMVDTDSAKAGHYYRQALLRGDDQPPVVIECADHLVRTGHVAEAQDLVLGIEPVQPFFRRRKEHILSLIAAGAG